MADMPNRGENQPNTLLGIGLMIALLFILWFVFHDPMARFFLTIGHGFFVVLKWTVGWFQPELFAGMERQFQGVMQPANLRKVEISHLTGLSSWMGTYFRWPVIVLMGAMAWRVWRHPIMWLNTRHTFETLIRYQSQFWKPIVPVVHLNLVDDTSPQWAPAQRCVQLAKDHRLIHARRLKLEEAWTLLENQLGIRFHPLRLKDHEKALFAVFAARIVRDKGKKTADGLLDALNESCRGKDKPDFSVVMGAYEKYKGDKRVLDKIKGYGYVRTVLFQMLVEARRFDGKLPTSHFLWLRPLDRTLWYALDRAPVDTGRYSIAGFPEGMAVVGQWQAESLALQNRMRMSVRRMDKDTGLTYQVSVPYLVNVLTAMAIDLEDFGEIDFPDKVASKVKKTSNERLRFNTLRDEYVMAGLTPYFEERYERARKAALAKTVKEKK